MAYAALTAAGIVLVFIVAAVLRRDSRHWMRRPAMADYSAAVTELGLTTAEQVRLERLTRRGRAVPPREAGAAANYARAALEVRRRTRTRTRRQLEVVVGGFGAVLLLFLAGELMVGEFEWSSLPLLCVWVMWTPFLLFRPAVDRWYDDRLGRAIDRDTEQQADGAVR